MPLKTYYVSLTRDLIGCYLAFQAVSETAVQQYMAREYHLTTPGTNVWKLHWCAIYTDHLALRGHAGRLPVVIPVHHILEEEDRMPV